jgi:hypothetical protein
MSDLIGTTDERVEQLVEQVVEIAEANEYTNELFRDVFALAKTLQPGEAMFVGFVLHDIYSQLEEMEDE